MKPVRLRPRARDDRRVELRYCRDDAGTAVAARLLAALEQALDTLRQNPAIGSPALGRELGVDGLRTWAVDGFPLNIWYFERDDLVDVVRLVGQRQDAPRVDVE